MALSCCPWPSSQKPRRAGPIQASLLCGTGERRAVAMGHFCTHGGSVVPSKLLLLSVEIYCAAGQLRDRATRPAKVKRRSAGRSEEHKSELQSRSDLVCRPLL